ncbi:hypothetical protein PG985_009461 [Apiospora marii]|uniref:uncharacterized protein n=1 Tax=Apiospora marii TaxID=335849 RepID=UPI0031305E35
MSSKNDPRPLLPREPANNNTAELQQRDQLWNLLMPPKPAGCESWVLPWPKNLDEGKLVCSYLDERFVRLVARTEKAPEGGEALQALILTPAHADMYIHDPRLQLAMIHNWGRLNHWLKKVLGGVDITLLEYLRDNTARMVTLMQQRLANATEQEYFADAGFGST